MADYPNLAVDRTTLLRELGRQQGWSRDPGDWDDRQQADGDDILRRALTQVYYPSPLEGERTSHTWACLRPITIIQTETGKGDADLPDDFGGMTGDIQYVNNESSRIVKVTPAEILEMRRQADDTTGYPRYYAITPQRSEGTRPQRWTLMLHPIPQDNYELKVEYKSDPLNIGDSFPYPLGGQMMADALVASVICVAEEVLSDVHQGPAYATFLQKLRTAIYQDRQENFTGNLGYNGDGRSSLVERGDNQTFTILGEEPSSHPGFYFSS